jgi:hypothetical protein
MRDKQENMKGKTGQREHDGQQENKNMMEIQ